MGRNGLEADLIRGTSMFRGLSKRDAARLAAAADEIHVDQGEVLAREDQPAHGLYVVIEGWADVSCRGERLEIVGPGTTVGQPGTSRSGQPVTITAATPMRLLVLDAELAFSLLGSSPYPPGMEPPSIE
jgi:CRP-like cAMP-binding protein